MYTEKIRGTEKYDILQLHLDFSIEAFWEAYVSFRGNEKLVAPPYFEHWLHVKDGF